MTIPTELDGYDWGQVFGAAGETSDDSTIYNPGVPFLAVPPGDQDEHVPQPTFTRHDVVTVLAAETWGEDDPSWACVVELSDGRFAALTGSHDYTGWD